jgi:hypothetical protein
MNIGAIQHGKHSPSMKSPHGDTLRPYADYPHLLGTDPRRGTLFGGFGETGVWRILFVDQESAAPFGEGCAVDAGTVLCAVNIAEATKCAPSRLLPDALRSQSNLVFEVALGGELGDLFARTLKGFGLWRTVQSIPNQAR